ncbi:MAG: septum formation protein Maf [Cyclobacteriaceae bacterium]
MSNLILASNSPRRQELLKQAGYQFEVFTKDFDEPSNDELSAIDLARFLAEYKNDRYRELLNSEVIITSDTVVVSESIALGKPKDRIEAINMISKLMGKYHQVSSGVCISSKDKRVSFDDVTLVSFKVLSEKEIEYYVDAFMPFDKAGAYGIQEWIGMIGIDKIKGSFYTVMGLPVHKVYDCLKNEFGIKPL